MKCYYEELGVSRDADDAEIKSAYRKLALRWHPDKNLERSDEAKEKFQKIQQAYEVLSDPQERAFFDKHRDQILRGKNSNYEDNTLDVFPYFTSACYKGFGDDEKGFYAVYREVFNKIAAEDAEFMDSDDELDEIPAFGDSKSSYEDVVGPFYAYWQSYCTKKNYAWLCPYDIQEIKDRRVLRAIEKETKKIVQNAKKERNEEIRSLVAFVRKRDKRVQAYNRILEERAALNREKALKNRQAQILKRQQELAEIKKNKSKSDNDGYEEQLKQLEQQYGNDSDEYVTDESDENEDDGENDEIEENYDEEFFCVACSKAFKNAKNFENHCTSKKHRENEELLRQEMLEEEESFGKLNINGGEEAEADTENEAEAEAELNTDVDDNLDIDDEAAGAALVEENENLKNSISNGLAKSKKSKKTKKNLPKFVNDTVDHDDESEAEKTILVTEISDDDDDDWGNNKKGNRKQQKKKQTKKTESVIKPQAEKPSTVTTEPAAVETIKNLDHDEQSSTTTHLCATCKSTFESKNKLFAHLKKTNHSVYLPKTNATKTTQSVEGAAKKGKGKRR